MTGRHESRTCGWRARVAGILGICAAGLLAERAGIGRGRRTGEVGTEVRLHQAHRHGAAGHRLGEGLLRGRGPVRHAGAAGQLEGAARPRHQRRARRRAHAGRPAARRRPSASAPRRDIVTPFSMDLTATRITVSNAVWAEMKPTRAGRRTASRCIRSGRRAEAGGRASTRRRASPSTWAWSSRSPRTTTNCATGWPPAASTRASTHRTRATPPASSAPTCCCR